jgi:hypothetical protein
MTAALDAAVVAHLEATGRTQWLGWPLPRLLTAISSVLQGLCLVGHLCPEPDGGFDADALVDAGQEAVDGLIAHVADASGMRRSCLIDPMH